VSEKERGDDGREGEGEDGWMDGLGDKCRVMPKRGATFSFGSLLALSWLQPHLDWVVRYSGSLGSGKFRD
jgi:hypothetical protein